ncbi:mitochondrial protein Pet127-domain-containing protein, partial [Microdochium trichocladiopsis]
KKLAISTVKSKSLELTPIDKLTIPVPRLAHGLDRVLFNPGVYFLQDPRSRVFNFDPYLANIMPIQEFDFNALKQYITSSKDTTLISKAKAHNKKYTGSTSSMTAMLSHFHYLLSSWRPINSAMMSAEFKPESKRFTRIMRAPAATFLHWKDGCYAIDADKEYDSANILSMLGKSMEKLLTLPKHKFEQYRHANSDQISEEERNADEAFHYTGFQDFMMRSQLDAYDKRVPGTGMFDLKTRAVVSIRMDARNFHQGLGYEIRHRFGQWESYEREYFDMIRSAFLKYSLQVRMGRMDGIYVAYHNTERIFGFQYIPIPEMDLALHGTNNTTLGDREYKLSLTLLNQLLDRASKRWPEQSLRIHFETRESIVAPFMYVFARPVEKGDIEAVQNAGKAQVEEFERTILGLKKPEDAEGDSKEVSGDSVVAAESTANGQAGEHVELAEQSTAEADAQRLAVWDEVQQVVEDAMSDEEVGISSVREAIQNALEESSLLEVESMAETRQYIDALLTAITGVPPPSSSAELTESAKAHHEGSDTATSAETAAESLKPRGTATKTSLSPLKDLIALSAQRLHDRPGAEAEIEAADEDSQKLKVFEEILGRMISQAKAEQSTAGDTIGDPQSASDSTSTIGTGNDGSAAPETSTDPLDPWGAEEAELEKLAAEEGLEVDEDDDFELLGMVLTIKNKVNGEYVERPENLTKHDEWDVEYNIEELPEARAHTLYKQCLMRRKTVFMGARDKAAFESMYAGALARSTNKGREFRQKETQRAKRQPVHIYGSRQAHRYRDVFG